MTHHLSPAARPSTKLVELTGFALCVAQLTILFALLTKGAWLFDADGNAVATDFVNIWAAGRQVVEGSAALVYDGMIHKHMEVIAVGHSFDGDYPWVYPPPFFFVATALSLLPYTSAYLVWMAVTFLLYVIAVRLIVGPSSRFLFAVACPAILANFVVGQSGFLTAALLGLSLVSMDARPVLSGIFLGLLTFKPHLGILIPVVLLIDRRWQVIASATATAVVLAAGSMIAFGYSPWEEFFHLLPLAADATLVEGQADWGKLQSLYGAVRVLGGTHSIAWTFQVTIAIAAAIAVSLIWRGGYCFELRAASLATGTLLATPYIFLYDLVGLAVAMAFLMRAGQKTGRDLGENVGLSLARACRHLGDSQISRSVIHEEPS